MTKTTTTPTKQTRATAEAIAAAERLLTVWDATTGLSLMESASIIDSATGLPALLAANQAMREALKPFADLLEFEWDETQTRIEVTVQVADIRAAIQALSLTEKP